MLINQCQQVTCSCLLFLFFFPILTLSQKSFTCWLLSNIYSCSLSEPDKNYLGCFKHCLNSDPFKRLGYRNYCSQSYLLQAATMATNSIGEILRGPSKQCILWIYYCCTVELLITRECNSPVSILFRIQNIWGRNNLLLWCPKTNSKYRQGIYR